MSKTELTPEQFKKGYYDSRNELGGKKAALRKIADAINDETKSDHEKLNRVIDVLQISGAWIKTLPTEGDIAQS